MHLVQFWISKYSWKLCIEYTKYDWLSFARHLLSYIYFIARINYNYFFTFHLIKSTFTFSRPHNLIQWFRWCQMFSKSSWKMVRQSLSSMTLPQLFRWIKVPIVELMNLNPNVQEMKLEDFDEVKSLYYFLGWDWSIWQAEHNTKTKVSLPSANFDTTFRWC